MPRPCLHRCALFDVVGISVVNRRDAPDRAAPMVERGLHNVNGYPELGAAGGKCPPQIMEGPRRPSRHQAIEARLDIVDPANWNAAGKCETEIRTGYARQCLKDLDRRIRQ